MDEQRAGERDAGKRDYLWLKHTRLRPPSYGVSARLPFGAAIRGRFLAPAELCGFSRCGFFMSRNVSGSLGAAIE